MQIYQTKGRECFFYILRKWPNIVVGAIVVAILLGARTGINTYKSWGQKQADVDAVRQRREEYLDYFEQSLEMYETEIADKEAQLTEYSQQLNDADLLRYNESAIGIAYVDLYFVSYNEDGSVKEIPTGLLELFSTTLENSVDWEMVAEAGNADIDFLDQTLVMNVDAATNRILSLKIFGENEESAAAMLDEILDQADDLKSELGNQIGDFEYNAVNKSSREGRDEDFTEIKNKIQNKYNDIQNSLNTLNTSKDELLGPPEEIFMPTPFQVAMSIIKHALFGGAIGIVAMVAVFYLLFYLNGKLHSADELSYYTDTTAMIYKGKAKKSKFAKLNSFIAKKENRGLVYSQQEAVMRTVSNIKAQYSDVAKVMFTGINIGSESEGLKKALTSAKGQGLMFGFEKNILTDKEAFDHLGYYDAVVLVEKIDKTGIQLINKEIEQIKIAGKEVVGSLIVR